MEAQEVPGPVRVLHSARPGFRSARWTLVALHLEPGSVPGQ